MAKKNKDNGKLREVSKPPEGFTKIVSAERFYWPRQDEEGNPNPCQGVLVDRVQRWDGDGHQFVLELTEPCLAIATDGEERVIKVLGPGEQLRVDESQQLEAVFGYYQEGLRNGRLLEVRIDPKGKKDLSGGRTLWLYDVYARPSDRVAPRRLTESTEPEVVDAELPFS